MQINQTDWEKVPYFLAVARHGSLRAAAEELGTSHLKVNRQLAALEAAFGVQLVQRGPRGVVLTDAGKTLLPVAEEADELFVGAQRTLHGLDKQERGIVKFSTSGPLGYYLVAPILAEFSQEYPQIEIELQVGTAFQDPKLIGTDVSLRMVYEVGDDAIVKKLFPIAIGTFASQQYIAEHFAQKGPGGIGLTWIGGPKVESDPQWVKNSPYPKAAVRHGIPDPIMQLELAKQHLGMAYIAAFFAFKDGALAQVPGTELAAGPPLCIIIHPELRRTVRVRRFVDFLEKRLRQMKPLITGQELAR